MMDHAEKSLSRFYNSVGWEGEITEDAKIWEDLRDYTQEYASKSRLRVLRHIPPSGNNILDMASGPIQYKEYLEYSKNFKKRYCVDLSLVALEKAKERIGDRGVFLHGNFLDIPIEENLFDCAVSLHTIYHIDQGRQEEAVRKLLYATKPGRPVIIVYSNPKSFASLLTLPLHWLKRLMRRQGKGSADSDLYFYVHPIQWWSRFSNSASVQIVPWRSFSSETQKVLIPNNIIGKKMLAMLFALEELCPAIFARYARYPMIILTKNI